MGLVSKIKEFIHPERQLYVIAVVFNPLGFRSRYKLYRDFAPYIEYSGAKLLTVEIAFRDRPFEVTSRWNPWHLQLRTNQELWLKENGINLGFQRLFELVPKAKYIAWIDADVKFARPDWVKETINKLQHHDVIQLFSEAQSLTSRYESQWKTPGLFYNYLTKIGYHQEPPLSLKYTSGGHPGLAWGITKEAYLKIGGLLDFCIHGSGDTHMANSLMGDVTLGLKKGATKEFYSKLHEWEAKCKEHIKLNIGYVPGICLHYWHGRPQKRGYEKRWDLICFHKFDPTKDLNVNEDGLYELVPEKFHLRYDLRRSLSERNEDEI